MRSIINEHNLILQGPQPEIRLREIEFLRVCFLNHGFYVSNKSTVLNLNITNVYVLQSWSFIRTS